MSAPDIPRIFDPVRHRRQLARAAPNYHQYDFLKTRVSSELIERLEDSQRRFPRALDLGSHTGVLAASLAAHGKIDHVVALDPAPAMAGRARAGDVAALAADFEALPFAPASFDLVASALALHWVNDLPGLLVQVREMLAPDGLFLAGLFGAGTLTELRASLLQAESELTGGAAVRLSPLPGLQDMAGLMQRAGFAMPVADIDHVTVTYSSPFRLLEDLGGMGERAALADVPPQGLSRRILERMAEIYAAEFSEPGGKVRASFEIVWVSGWAPALGQPKPLRPGSARASLATAVGAKERSAGEKAGR